MPNTWFQFKQFIIRQESSAMKVGTDSVILGAWVSAVNIGRILDVGAGTGILSLMIAQRTRAFIDAVEIDEGAYRQSVINAGNSPWKNRIRIIPGSFQNYSNECNLRYDLLISNPPFFMNSQKAGSGERSMARHADSLSLEELLKGANRLLDRNGKLALILPAAGFENFIALAAKVGLKPARALKIFPKPGTVAKRVAAEFTFFAMNIEEEELIIESGGRHVYSEEYKSLTKDFYL